jgi:hypothetical protein
VTGSRDRCVGNLEVKESLQAHLPGSCTLGTACPPAGEISTRSGACARTDLLLLPEAASSRACAGLSLARPGRHRKRERAARYLFYVSRRGLLASESSRRLVRGRPQTPHLPQRLPENLAEAGHVVFSPSRANARGDGLSFKIIEIHVHNDRFPDEGSAEGCRGCRQISSRPGSSGTLIIPVARSCC